MRSVRSREIGDSRELVPVFFKDYRRYGESRGNGDVLTVIVWPEPLIADRSLQSNVGAVERVYQIGDASTTVYIMSWVDGWERWCRLSVV
jgi:hypothetical protein